MGKPVAIGIAAGPYTGKGYTASDEAQLYEISAVGVVESAATIRVHWSSRHRVRGNIKFNFQIGA